MTSLKSDDVMQQFVRNVVIYLRKRNRQITVSMKPVIFERNSEKPRVKTIYCTPFNN